jgi:hypothetical protein
MKSLIRYLEQFDQMPFLVMPRAYKMAFLLEIDRMKRLLPCLLIEESVLKDEVSEQALIHLKAHHDIDYYLGSRIRQVLPYVKWNFPYQNQKLLLLQKYKVEMIKAGIIIPAVTFALLNKPVVSAFLPLYDPRFENYDFYEYLPGNKRTQKIPLTVCKDPFEQVHAVIAAIDELLEAHIDIDQIIIVNPGSSDEWLLQKEAGFYGFDVQYRTSITLDSHPEVIRFLREMDEMKVFEALESWKKRLSSSFQPDLKIYESVIEIIDAYGIDAIEQDRQLLMFELDTRTIPEPTFSHVVQIIGLEDAFSDPMVYYLVMNYVDSEFPVLRRDDDYLTDSEKLELGLRTSAQENARILNDLKIKLLSTDKVALYRSKQAAGKELKRCDLLDASMLDERDYAPTTASISRSRAFDYLNYAKADYDFCHFGIKAENYTLLKRTFSPFHSRTDFQFKGLELATQERLIAKGFNFSATNLERFNACRFRFMLDFLIKILPNETSDSMFLGNLAHDILAKTLDNDTDIESLAIEYRQRHNVILTPKMELLTQLFLNRLKTVIEYLKFVDQGSQFVDFGFEAEYEHRLIEHPAFGMKGKIDRIKILKEADQTQVAVIDFKTGSKKFDFDDYEKGIDIQPLFYLNLLQKCVFKTDFSPFGFYYQPINVKRMKKMSDGNELEKALKLDGITVENKRLVEAFTVNDNLSGIKINQSGEFRKTDRLVAKETLLTMIRSVDSWINHAIERMEKGDYRISPLSGSSEYDDSPSCQYCDHANICYMANNRVAPPNETSEPEGDD